MNKQFTFVTAPALAVALSSAASADLVYDNGGPDGVGGLSNIFDGGFDADRQVADDFILAGDPGWLIHNVEINYIWNTVGQGGASDFRVTFYADDAGGGPGTIVSDQVSTDFTETATGNVFFSRPEQIFSINIAPVALAADTTYWVASQPNGVENGFQLTANTNNTNGSEVWVLYPDLTGPDWVPGSSLFGGTMHDVTFRLNGEVVPAPGALALLGFASLVSIRRRRR